MVKVSWSCSIHKQHCGSHSFTYLGRYLEGVFGMGFSRKWKQTTKSAIPGKAITCPPSGPHTCASSSSLNFGKTRETLSPKRISAPILTTLKIPPNRP